MPHRGQPSCHHSAVEKGQKANRLLADHKDDGESVIVCHTLMQENTKFTNDCEIHH